MRWNQACDFWLDVAEFERLASVPHRLREAVALYTDDLLIDIDDEWLNAERERLRKRYVASLAALVQQLRAACEFQAAIDAAQRLLAQDPWREDIFRSLIALQYEYGDRAGALAEYERFARSLEDELQIEPMPETQAVYDAIVRDLHPPEKARSRPAMLATSAAAPATLPFVARSAEMAALRERLETAASGSGGLVLIGGEAGIGKTRLVREFASHCEARGAQIYVAATTFPEPTPYQPFVELLSHVAPLLKAARVDPVWLSAIVPLAPGMLQNVDALPKIGTVEPARERLRLFEACANVWQAIAERRPVVLVLEDLHWAGAATIALLEYLARRCLQSRVLLLATYREDELELSHPLRALRRHFEREGTGFHLALSRLSRDAVETLLSSLAEASDARLLATLLHGCSEGNPFFLQEALRELADTQRLHIVEGRWRCEESPETIVPRAVREALGERVARLDERSKTLAEVAATIGRGFDVELLRETTGWLEAHVLETLGKLIDSRVVSEQGTRGGFDYAFTHHLIQTVVYDGIRPSARTRRHHRVASVMTQLYADGLHDNAAELAFHWDRGGEAELAAKHHLLAAKRAHEIYSNEETLLHVARALALTKSPAVRFEALLLRERNASLRGDRETQTRDNSELTCIAWALGQDAAICTALERRVQLANVTGDRRREGTLLALLQRRVRRSGDLRWKARALEAQASYLRATSEFEASREAFMEMVDLAECCGDRGASVGARLALADTYIYEGRLQEARAALEDVRGALEADGNRGELIRTLMTFSRAALAQQDYGAMSSFALEAHDLSCAIGDREGEALALHTLGNGLVYTFRVTEADSYYRRAYELYERIGHRVGLASILVDRGLFATELGLLDSALESYARARAIAHDIGFRFVACVERIDASYCRRLRGEFELAKEAAATAVALTREIRSQHLESAALGTLGAAESALGDYPAAIAHLRLGVELRRPAGQTPRLGDNLCALALAHLGAGEPDAAQHAAHEMLELYIANPKLAPQPTEWLWAAAEVERARERRYEAEKLVRQAESVMSARAAAIDDPVTRAAYLALPFNRAVTRALSVMV